MKILFKQPESEVHVLSSDKTHKMEGTATECPNVHEEAIQKSKREGKPYIELEEDRRTRLVTSCVGTIL